VGLGTVVLPIGSPDVEQVRDYQFSSVTEISPFGPELAYPLNEIVGLALVPRHMVEG